MVYGLRESVLTQCILHSLFSKHTLKPIARTKKEILIYSRKHFGKRLQFHRILNVHILKELKDLCSDGLLLFSDGRYHLGQEVIVRYNDLMTSPAPRLRSPQCGFNQPGDRICTNCFNQQVVRARLYLHMFTAQCCMYSLVCDALALSVAVCLTNIAAAMVFLAGGNVERDLVFWAAFLPA